MSWSRRTSRITFANHQGHQIPESESTGMLITVTGLVFMVWILYWDRLGVRGAFWDRLVGSRPSPGAPLWFPGMMRISEWDTEVSGLKTNHSQGTAHQLLIHHQSRMDKLMPPWAQGPLTRIVDSLVNSDETFNPRKYPLVSLQCHNHCVLRSDPWAPAPLSIASKENTQI